jgi:hypothetical protein
MAKSTLLDRPDLPAIEADLAKRISLRRLAERYGVSIDALYRHKHKLLRDALEMFLAVQAKELEDFGGRQQAHGLRSAGFLPPRLPPDRGV